MITPKLHGLQKLGSLEDLSHDLHLNLCCRLTLGRMTISHQDVSVVQPHGRDSAAAPRPVADRKHIETPKCNSDFISLSARSARPRMAEEWYRGVGGRVAESTRLGPGGPVSEPDATQASTSLDKAEIPPMSAHDVPGLPTRLGDFFKLNAEARSSYCDRDVKEVSTLLQGIGQNAWADVPRLYIVLRRIDQLQYLDSFIDQGLNDYWFPFDERSAPLVLAGSGRSDFLAAQDLIMTASVELEKGTNQKRHQHFPGKETAPFESRGTLGTGNFSRVDKVYSEFSRREYARKLFRRQRGPSKTDVKIFLNELSVMKRIHHRHCVELVGSYTDAKFFGLIMLPVADYNLHGMYDRAATSPEVRVILRSFFGCLSSAVQYLHSAQIRHRDLKPENVLVRGKDVYLADFGISLDWINLSRSTTIADSGRTPAYCAPEVDRDDPRNSSSDIWSLGCVFLEMVTVLKGRKIADMRQQFKAQTDTWAFHRNSAGIVSWIDDLRVRESEIDNEPLRWVDSMLQVSSNARPTPKLLHEQSLYRQPDSTNKLRPFCATCCIPHDLEESSSDDDISDGEAWEQGTSPTALKSTTDGFVKVLTTPKTLVSRKKDEGVATNRGLEYGGNVERSGRLALLKKEIQVATEPLKEAADKERVSDGDLSRQQQRDTPGQTPGPVPAASAEFERTSKQLNVEHSRKMQRILDKATRGKISPTSSDDDLDGLRRTRTLIVSPKKWLEERDSNRASEQPQILPAATATAPETNRPQYSVPSTRDTKSKDSIDQGTSVLSSLGSILGSETEDGGLAESLVTEPRPARSERPLDHIKVAYETKTGRVIKQLGTIDTRYRRTQNLDLSDWESPSKLVAAIGTHTSFMQYLHTKYGLIRIADDNGKPLFLYELLQIMVDYGYDFFETYNDSNRRGQDLLMKILGWLEFRDVELCFEYVIKQGGDLWININHYDAARTVYYQAARMKKLWALKLLAQKWTHLLVGYRCWMMQGATYGTSWEVVAYLQKEDIFPVDYKCPICGFKTLNGACAALDRDFVHMIFSQGERTLGALQNRWNGVSALHAAARDGNILSTVLSLSNVFDSSKTTPVLWVVVFGDPVLVKGLLQAKNWKRHIDTQSYDSDISGKCTPLYAACARNHLEVVRLLLEAGADVNAVGRADGGWTCLHIAVAKGSIQIVDLLMENGANTEVRTIPISKGLLGIRRRGDTPLGLAEKAGYARLVERLTRKSFTAPRSSQMPVAAEQAVAASLTALRDNARDHKVDKAEAEPDNQGVNDSDGGRIGLEAKPDAEEVKTADGVADATVSDGGKKRKGELSRHTIIERD